MTRSGPARTAPDPLAGRLPVTFITGFLGSGKTTLIRHLLSAPGMENIAVIINEFGDVGLDHELVQASSEQITLLANGCLCCTVRTDLQESLRELFIKRRAGEIMQFDRVIVETTGLADPVAAMQAILSDSMLEAQYCLNGVATVIDAVNGSHNLDSFDEALKQVAVADRLILTKTDIAGNDAVHMLQSRLATLNPYAPCTVAINGDIDPAVVLDVGLRHAHPEAAALLRWLPDTNNDSQDGPTEGIPLNQALRGSSQAPHAGIRACTLHFDHPIEWATLSATLQFLLTLRGADVLRVKGLVDVVGEAGPIVVQGSQHVFHPPVTLDAWPGATRRSRLVFITRDLTRETLAALFAAVDMLDPPRASRP